MWVIKFPDGHGYFNEEIGVTPHLQRAELYPEEGLANSDIGTDKIKLLILGCGQPKPQYVQLVEA